MERKNRLGFVGMAVALLLLAAPARAQLIPQLGTCTPPLDLDKPPDKATGYGNTPATRDLEFQFAWAHPAGQDAATAIAATTRVEVCWVGQNGTVHCPGWLSANNPKGDPAWIILDTDPAVNVTPDGKAAPTTDNVKLDTDDATRDNLRRFPIHGFDWDDTDPGKIAFLVVGAKHMPTSLADVANDITADGFCGIPYRLATKQTGNPPPEATPSAPGSALAAADHFVAYGLLDPAAPGAPCLVVTHPFPQPTEKFCSPEGWTFGDVCDSTVTNVAHFSRFNYPCVTQAGALLELGLLERIDNWQYEKVEGGLPLANRLQTWWNGPGGLAANECPGAICPTRVIYGNTIKSVGYGWGGLSTERPDTINTDGYQSLANLESGAAPDALHSGGLLRAIAHEYFHGFQATWKRETNVGKYNLYDNAILNESTGDVMPARACFTDYPGTTLTTALPSTQCVSSQTLYYNNLTPSGGTFMEDPGNLFTDPLFKYQGAMFYQYVA